MKKRSAQRMFGWFGIIFFSGIVFVGCSSPKVSQQSRVQLDEEVVPGGLGSEDIRSVAAQMCPAILSLPEITQARPPVRIAVSPMKNSSRFIVDMNLFMKKLRLDMNRYSEGKLRFFSQNNAAATRQEILKNRREEQVQKTLDALADSILNIPFIKEGTQPVTLSVLPVLNANFVKLNADSITAMLRSKVAEKSNGRVLFTMPGSEGKADYYLTGQFIADTIKQEGMVNLADYIQMMDERIKKGESLDLYDESPASVGENSGNQLNIISGEWRQRYPSLFNQLQISSSLRVEPNVTKRLNVMLVRASDKVSVWEKMFTVEKKISSGVEHADYLLSGEISGLSKRAGGTESDYILITMQLIDPETNEVLWEDGYEVKRKSESGTVYQ